MPVTDTASFRAALAVNPKEAEDWLIMVRANAEGHREYDARWFDHREHELFNEFCRRKEWRNAKRVVEETTNICSQQERRERLE